jgi:hypothetical protein
MDLGRTEDIHMDPTGRLNSEGRPLYYPILFPNELVLSSLALKAMADYIIFYSSFT